MVKKAILLLSAAACLSVAANAQNHVCGTDEYHRELIQRDPKVAEIQKALDMYLKGVNLKTTGASLDKYLQDMEDAYQDEIDTTLYIPVVVHVVHNYGAEYVPDTAIYRMIKNLNVVYEAQNDDLNDVIAPFKPYIGNMNVEFRLAQKDPQGNPTTGITRHRSNTTYGGDDQAKINQWDPQRYMNIWIENVIGRGAQGGIVLAYATLPAGAAAYPYSDGVMIAAPYINATSNKTIEHELGHYFNLYHTWNSSLQQAGVACGDDEVDDTPPTRGHFSTCPLYDTVCARGYTKTYVGDSVVDDTVHYPVDVVVDYPDTTNVQNIMDYSSCVNMFTKQQVMRARATLKSPVAGRQNLTDSLTHVITGVTGPKNDLPPVADYSIAFTTPQTDKVFLCASEKSFMFMNRSWRDTVISSAWEFPNGTPATSNAYTSVSVTINQPGWVKTKLTVTGNNTGTSTIEKAEAYAADPVNMIDPVAGYYQEFVPGSSDIEKYPIFNYFGNSNKWQVNSNTGFYDNSSMQYSGYDDREFPAAAINTPNGDWDDFFTPGFNLSAMTNGDCNLNFMYAGTYRVSDAAMMKDVLEVHYSTNCGDSWVKMDSLKKKDLANKGTLEIKFAPQWTGDWNLRSINIPAAARKEKVFFRFRYKAYGDGGFYQKGVGNNFYLDRLNVSNFPLGMNTVLSGKQEIALVPNPTTGNSYIVIKNNANTNAKVQVTDITGKVVYRTEQNLSGSMTRIEIPASAIAVKGMYMVQVVTGNEVHTEKLVAY